MQHVTRSIGRRIEQLRQTAGRLTSRFVDRSFRDADRRRNLAHAEPSRAQPQDVLSAGRELNKQALDQIVQFGLAGLLLGVGRQPLAGLDGLGDAEVPPLAACAASIGSAPC